MKILFAINNDNVSEAIVKKYQKEYKEILSYKNVYYFNAIYKELQRDKTYSRIVISEDLEPFANNNYQVIDKFLLDKYNRITEEIKNEPAANIDIILICADRRTKHDDILVKIYNNNGIYNAIIGQDRSIDEVCKLINRPRSQNEARVYYNIHESELTETDSEDSVSEAEVENIRSYYARLGKNEDKYVESFNNIVSQYNDTQLKIIIKYLPIHVKAVLEERSTKYQQLATTSTMNRFNAKEKTMKYKENIKNKKDDDDFDIAEQFTKPTRVQSVIIPSNITTDSVQKINIPKVKTPQIQENTMNEFVQREQNKANMKTDNNDDSIETNLDVKKVENEKEINIQEPAKRGRGRPKKNIIVEEQEQEQKVKRGRGRPKKEKNEIETSEQIKLEDKKISQEIAKTDEQSDEKDDIDLFELAYDIQPNKEENIKLFDTQAETKDVEDDLFNLNKEDEEEQEVDLFNYKNDANEEDEIDLFNIQNNSEDEIKPQYMKKDNIKREFNNIGYNQNMDNDINDKFMTTQINTSNNFNNLLTADKKIVAFVGTTKNGTSFVVNNTAEMLASMGINTAILDMTKSKNAYYIYTNNEENLRNVAKNCMEKLQTGIAEGIKVNRTLTVYTEMPGEVRNFDLDRILSTLLEKYSAILIDTDFDTNPEIFARSQEIYLVQTMDILTIQPLTAFLRNLKSKNILKPERLRIVINKSTKVRSLSTKTLIGGMSCYNAPNMTYMTELFNKDNIRYCEIPFEIQNYVKYLDGLVNCSISLNGYSKMLIGALQELANMVYPLVNKGQSYNSREPFSMQTNDTLSRMKNKY